MKSSELSITEVQHIAEKYGGHLSTIAPEEQFETIIVLPFGEL